MRITTANVWHLYYWIKPINPLKSLQGDFLQATPRTGAWTIDHDVSPVGEPD